MTRFRHALKCPNCQRTVMRISKVDDPLKLGVIVCGYCTTKLTGERCISTSIARPRGKSDIELLCVSIITAGLLAGAIEKASESTIGAARDLFDEIKKATGK